MMDDIQFAQWIKKCEGLRLHPYLDTVGKVTLGYGRNIDDLGISIQEAEFMLANDIARCKQEISDKEWYKNQPSNVQYALLNMCFNLGIERLEGFKAMIAALLVKDYTEAAREALNSKWAIQVGQRAKDIAVMIREG